MTGVALSCLGNGMTMSLLLVYLHEVRGLSTTTAGLVAAWMALSSLAFGPAVGALVDRRGPKPMLMAGLALSAIATALLTLVHAPWSAFAVATLLAAANASVWPPVTTMMARMVDQEHRQAVFGLHFMLLNLGLGLGGLASASIVDLSRPGTFTLLYLVDAATFVLYALILLGISGFNGPVPHDEDLSSADASASRGGYRDVMKDGRMRRIFAFSLILLTCGYGSMDAGIPLYIRLVAELDVSTIGLVFFANTIAIVIFQATVLRRIQGRSRTAVLSVVAVLWTGLWISVIVSSLVPPQFAVLVLMSGMVVFAFGECMLSPIGSAIVNDIAPEHLRGRYNALTSIQWGISGAIGPAFAGFMIGRGWGNAWALTLIAGCLLATLALPALRRQLTPEQDGRLPQGAAAN